LDECTDLPARQLPFVDGISREMFGLYAEVDSSYYFDGSSCVLFCKQALPLVETRTNAGDVVYPEESIGAIYEAASRYCFGDLSDAGGLMKLAPKGSPGVYREELFYCKDGALDVDLSVLAKFDRPFRTFDDLKANFQHYADFANWIQRETERSVLYIVNSRYEMCPSENLAYSGGVALNALINSKITKNTPFKNLYVQPAAGDKGISFGCVFYGWMEVLKKERVPYADKL
jgi:carbamoyltransferase